MVQVADAFYERCAYARSREVCEDNDIRQLLCMDRRKVDPVRHTARGLFRPTYAKADRAETHVTIAFTECLAHMRTTTYLGTCTLDMTFGHSILTQAARCNTVRPYILVTTACPGQSERSRLVITSCDSRHSVRERRQAA